MPRIGPGVALTGEGATPSRGLMGDHRSIRLQGKRFDFYVKLGEGAPKVAGGGAVYEEVARPEETAMTVLTGFALVKLDVPVLLDAWKTGRDVEPTVEFLRGLAVGDRKNPPPVFKASGPIPFSGMRFQMEMPEEGDGYRERVGDRLVLLRQPLTLKLVQYETPDAFKLRKRTSALGAATVAGGNVHVTKQDDTLLKISVEVYGDTSHAKEIGKINKIRDVRQKLKPGRTLRLPPG